MELPLSQQVVARLEFLAEAGSTNDVLVEHARADAGGWPDLSVVVTDNQTRGRGRLGRTWLAPTGKSLAISVLLRPELPGGGAFPPQRLGWFPLLAGAAMTLAVRDAVQTGVAHPKGTDAAPEEQPPRHDVALKWPNDVLIDGYKVSGVLSELLPDAAGLVIGTGLNLSLSEHDLPTLTSTSLLLVTGKPPITDVVLAGYLTHFAVLYRALLAANGDPQVSGLHDTVNELCGTLGSTVRVELPGGADIIGTAQRIDDDGRLVVQNDADGEVQAVAAGDVTHLRY